MNCEVVSIKAFEKKAYVYTTRLQAGIVDRIILTKRRKPIAVVAGLDFQQGSGIDSNVANGLAALVLERAIWAFNLAAEVLKTGIVYEVRQQDLKIIAASITKGMKTFGLPDGSDSREWMVWALGTGLRNSILDPRLNGTGLRNPKRPYGYLTIGNALRGALGRLDLISVEDDEEFEKAARCILSKQMTGN